MDRPSTVYESRYRILAVFVFVLLAIQTSNQQWSSDFWEHSAAVREMSLHPLAPRHPLLAIDVPHHSYSLYGLALALAVRWLQISPIAALSAVAMLNAALLFLFFPLAGAALARRRDLAFYALLFTLLLWGPAWRYSGFLHMNALGFVLPFPSMFATALAFLVIGSMPAFLGNASWRTVLPVGALVFLVVNAHPITGGVLIVACLALAVSAHPGRPAWERLSVALVLGLLAAIWWPLYPFLPLVLDGARDIAFQNQSMYMDIIPRTAPALLGVPLLLRRQRKNVRDPLGLLFVGLLVIYGVGGISKQWTLGRVMPFLVLPLHISLAEWVVDQERKPFSGGKRGMVWTGEGSDVCRRCAHCDFYLRRPRVGPDSTEGVASPSSARRSPSGSTLRGLRGIKAGSRGRRHSDRPGGYQFHHSDLWRKGGHEPAPSIRAGWRPTGPGCRAILLH